MSRRTPARTIPPPPAPPRPVLEDFLTLDIVTYPGCGPLATDFFTYIRECHPESDGAPAIEMMTGIPNLLGETVVQSMNRAMKVLNEKKAWAFLEDRNGKRVLRVWDELPRDQPLNENRLLFYTQILTLSCVIPRLEAGNKILASELQMLVSSVSLRAARLAAGIEVPPCWSSQFSPVPVIVKDAAKA